MFKRGVYFWRGCFIFFYPISSSTDSTVLSDVVLNDLTCLVMRYKHIQSCACLRCSCSQKRTSTKNETEETPAAWTVAYQSTCPTCREHSMNPPFVPLHPLPCLQVTQEEWHFLRKTIEVVSFRQGHQEVIIVHLSSGAGPPGSQFQ